MKKKATARPAKRKAKPKPAARTTAPRKAKAEAEHAGSAEGVVYTSVLRELMASRLARG
ncbi:MAG TPA: hypothetical protein VEG67_08965 [Myxococcota bacterium]|nr:hypothetical protein [Myxococcota bacterium]